MSNFQLQGFNFENNHLVKISDQTDWSTFIAEVDPLFAKEGRNFKSVRKMLALKMAKTHFNGISDERIVDNLRTDGTLIYFCGFDRPSCEEEIPDFQST